ncbi:hypothetical protein [Hydrogenophaga defluvii]|uniref:Uncharacterized protein n=1 Tax=Hydrogenophaga defluvii TaxID=249410 RepID=A0ABW2S8J3_9BURK
MDVKLSTAVRQAMAVAFIAELDADTNPAYLEFYTGTKPAGPGTAVTDQVLLGTATCSATSATATAGVVTFNGITQDAAADASGTVTWARAHDGAGVPHTDYDVTNSAGDGAIKVNTTTIVAGGPIAVTSFTVTMPGA